MQEVGGDRRIPVSGNFINGEVETLEVKEALG